MIRDLAVMLADGGECVSDLGATRDQDALFGSGGVGLDRVSDGRPDRVDAGAAGRCPGRARQGAGAVLGACMVRRSG